MSRLVSPFRLRTTSETWSVAISGIALLLCALPQWYALPVAPPGEEWLRDQMIRLHAREIDDERVLVVDIDESSLANAPWPWPRGRLADMVEMLLADGARGVALDILLEKPADPDGDARLAMLAAHGPLVLAQMFDYLPRALPLRSGQIGGGTLATDGSAAPAGTGYLGVHAGLAGARYFGNIGVQPDADGVLRRIPMVTHFEGRNYPTLSRALVACCAAAPAPVPADAGSVRIPYSRNWDSYTVLKAADLLAGRATAAMVANRLVLIGSSSLSIGDRVATPLGASSAGLLVHAAMLSAQLDQQAGASPAVWPGRSMALTYTLAVVLCSAIGFRRLSAINNALLLILSTLVWLALAYAIAPHDPSAALAAPLLSNLFLLAVAVPFHWQLTQQRSRQLLGTLRQYVATAVVDELLRSNLQDPLQPRLAQVTTLIADMQDYTAQVESLPLDQAARLTTDFLDCLTRPVLDQLGTLDKYTGDGLVAFWGAPLPNADHADLALDAAQRMLQDVASFSRQRQARGLPPIRVRIGIESGPAMAGDFGTSFRSIYTAVGDSVNTASRLEQAARDYPHDLIIGEGTVALAKRHRFLPLGERNLRGKERAIQVYTLESAQ